MTRSSRKIRARRSSAWRGTVPRVGADVLLSIALGWTLGPLVGGFVTTWVGRPAGPLPAMVVGLFFFAADVANLYMFGAPAWLWVVGLLAPLPAAWLGFAWARRRHSPG